MAEASPRVAELLSVDGPFRRLARDLQGAMGRELDLGRARVSARPSR